MFFCIFAFKKNETIANKTILWVCQVCPSVYPHAHSRQSQNQSETYLEGWFHLTPRLALFEILFPRLVVNALVLSLPILLSSSQKRMLHNFGIHRHLITDFVGMLHNIWTPR